MSIVTFPALIKQISIKSLVTGDKEAEMVLRFRPSDGILNGINGLHRADSEIVVHLSEVYDDLPSTEIQQRNQNEISKGSFRKSKRQKEGDCQ